MEHEKFNTTEIIEFYFNQKLEIPQVIRTLNFTEESKKLVILNLPGKDSYPRSTLLEETLAENILKNLPFKAYENLITLDWVTNNSRNQKIITTALLHKKFEVVDFLLEKIENWSQKELKDADLSRNDLHHKARVYASNVLEPIRDWISNISSSHIGYNKKDVESFVPLWSKSIELLVNNEQMRLLNYNKISESPSLLDKFIFTHERPNDNPVYGLFRNLIEAPNTYDLFIELFKQLTNDEKKTLFTKGVDEEEALSQHALSYSNKKVVDFLEKNKLIENHNYQNSLGNLSESLLYKTSSKKKEKIDSNLWLYKKASTELSTKQKLAIPAHDIIGLFVGFQKHEVIWNELMSDYPQVTKKDLFKDEPSNIHQLNLALKINSQLIKNKKLFADSLDSDNQQILSLVPTLYKAFELKEDNINLSKTIDSPLYEKLISFIQKDHSINQDKARTLLLETALSLTLENKPETTKIKI